MPIEYFCVFLTLFTVRRDYCEFIKIMRRSSPLQEMIDKELGRLNLLSVSALQKRALDLLVAASAVREAVDVM